MGISLYDPFPKMSFCNRCIIPSSNGKINLSIPVIGGRENRQPMKDVRIDNSVRWQNRHWRTIKSAYGRSPWFEFYAFGLEAYFQREYILLADWNLDLMAWIFQCLGTATIIEKLTLEPTEYSGIDNRNKILPKNFQSSGMIKNLPVYPQVFQEKIGFQPNMSIVDLIFCEGKNALRLLQGATS